MSFEERLLEIIRERGEVSTTELVNITGAPRHRVLRALNKLYFKGLVEPVKRSRKYLWRLATGEMAIFPVHTPLQQVLYIEGVVEPIYRRVDDRVDSFLFVHVKDKLYWLCDCGTGYLVLTDGKIDGCDCKLRHAFGERKLAMIYLTGDLRFKYWRSYRYGEEGVEFVVLTPEDKESPELLEKYRKYAEGSAAPQEPGGSQEAQRE
nr:MAG: CopY family transcriptional regulator [Thermoproteus sp. AZ2]